MTWTRALVTGASGGIGRETALLLADEGTHLVLVARSADALEEVAGMADQRGVEAEVLPADLTDPGDLARVEARLTDADNPVDLLVNNAGFGTFGRFPDLDVEREAGQVQLNVHALVRLAHAAARTMRPRGGGGVLNVGSIAGYQPIPGNATYAATKAFVNSFSQALHEELKPSGVTVTLLAPGFTRTGFQETADVGEQSSALPGVAWLEARSVARAGLDGVARGQAVVVPGLLYRLTTPLLSVTPAGLSRRVAGTVMRRLG